jgi:N-acetylmuramoyl-L-alanine amidase
MKPEIIILHHSLTRDGETVSWGAIRRYHTETLGWSDCGYHAGIELVGDHYEILTGRMLNEKGAHVRGQNNHTLGICFVGNFDIDEVPPEQWNLGVRYVASLCDVLNIKPVHIYGHNEYSNYKTCPGKNFNVIGFQNQVREILSA